MPESTKAGHYGLMAEFINPQALLDAILAAKRKGYSVMDAFTPFPIEAVSEEIENHRPSKVPLVVLIGGLTGAAFGFGLQWWVSAVDYPINIGGRPLFSWPAFIPVAFETTILFAAFAAVIGMIALNRLPEPYHPVFNVEGFERALQDRYFLLVESRDPEYDPEETRGFLADLGPQKVHEVDW